MRNWQEPDCNDTSYHNWIDSVSIVIARYIPCDKLDRQLGQRILLPLFKPPNLMAQDAFSMLAFT